MDRGHCRCELQEQIAYERFANAHEAKCGTGLWRSVLNLDRLRTFRKVIELESFSRAAEELFLSQPAVSLQIRHLERELAVVLIDRTTSRPTATKAGAALLAFAEHVEEGNARLQRDLAAIQNEQAFVSIGCSATSAKQFVPRIISEVSRIAPDVHMRVITLPPDEAAAKMLRGELDFVLTTDGFISSRVDATHILTARLFVVGQPTNPLARRPRVTPEEVARYPFALLPAPWSAQARFREWAANQGVEIHVAMELSSYDGLKEAARSGTALAVVAETAIVGDVQRGDLAIIRTVGLPIEYPIFIAHRAGPLTPHAEAVKTAAMRMAGADRPMLDRDV